MPSIPTLEDRVPIRYLAIAGSGSGDSEFRGFADSTFPALFGAVGELDLTPAAAPFFRYHRFALDGDFEVEIGVPVDGGVGSGGTGEAFFGELPAGRYAVHVHEGAYSADDETWADRDLDSAYRHLEQWAADRGITWATEDGRNVAWTEQYLVGPAETSDVGAWRTQIARLVAE
ncbi:MAG: GyrI-like domain-containing protein [Patulibacter sp.]